jgi:hypothetical protein
VSREGIDGHQALQSDRSKGSSGAIQIVGHRDTARCRRPGDSYVGFFMLSYFVEVEATLERLDGLGLGGPPRRVIQGIPNGDITIALVRDPDGVRGY